MNPALPQRPLGRTGLRIPALALGTVELGMDYGIAAAGDHRRPDEASAARLLNRALDLGVTFIDTARWYGEAEGVIGRAIGHRRAEFVLASKVATPAALRGPALAAHVAQELETSLRTLGTDCIDLVYSHTATVEEITRGEVFEALSAARRAGKLRAIGASTYGSDAPRAAIAQGGYDCIQVAYNLLDRTLDAEVLPAARAAGIGVVARSVLLKGVLTHRAAHLPPALAPLREAATRATAIGQAAGIHSLPELAYRFALANPALSAALIGTAHLDELETCVRYAHAAPLDAGTLTRLDGVAISDLDLLNPGKWPAF